ncbi:MAG: hypothetical protein K0R82_2652 [Flavipsychrobacter sp.]|jgi:hypothetical protein|nr:hypothetical protein [Flavipsychrobacter sp.]
MFKRIGGWNYAGVVVIAGVMGASSIFTMLTPDELDQLQTRWWSTFLSRQLGFTFYSFIALSFLLLINVIYDLTSRGEINWRRLVDIIFFGMIVCFMTTLLGNLVLMSV